MVLVMQNPEEEKKTPDYRMIQMEGKKQDILAQHEGSVSWLESNYFKAGDPSERDGGFIVYREETNYGNCAITLYKDGKTEGCLDLKSIFSADKEVENLQEEVQEKLDEVKETFKNELYEIKSNVGEKQTGIEERMKGVIPSGVEMESPFDLYMNGCGETSIIEVGNIDDRYIDEIEAKVKIEYRISVKKGQKSAEEIFGLFMETVKAFEGKF